MYRKSFFKNIKTIAFVGLSDKPDHYSYEVGSYLKSQGYRIIPVNPKITAVLGEKAFPDISSIPENINIDVVDIFRKSENVLPHVKEIVKRHDVKTLWMQEGVINIEAEVLAKTHGLEVVMDRCLMKAHKEYIEKAQFKHI